MTDNQHGVSSPSPNGRGSQAWHAGQSNAIALSASGQGTRTCSGRKLLNIKARPGSAMWLLRHELRLFWRTTFKRRSTLVAFIGFVVFLHAAAVPIAFALPL